MNFTYRLIVESELDEVVCDLSASSMSGLEEDLLRKAEHAVKKYESDKEVEAQWEIDRQQEEAEEAEGPDHYGIRN